jgi:DNA repair ATPase RecN
MKLKELLKDHQLYHSEFQQDFFITTKAGGTEYGQYKQALRELNGRYTGLKNLYAEKELLQIDIDELAENKVKDKYEKRRNEIKLTQKIMNMEDMDKSISETEREFKRFYQQAVALKEKIGDLTDGKRDILDRDMWEFKIKEMAAIDWITTSRLSKGTIEILMCVPKEMRHKLLNEIKDQSGLIEWYEGRNDTVLELPDIDDKKLLEDFRND